MQRKHLCGVLAVCVVACAHVVYSQGDLDSQFILSIKLTEKTSKAKGDQSKVLAEPIIATTIGRPFSLKSGGTVKAKSGDGDLEIGTRITGKLEGAENGSLRLAMTIHLSEVVTQENDPGTDVVRTESLEIRTVLQPGKAQRLECSANQWCEVIINGIE